MRLATRNRSRRVQLGVEALENREVLDAATLWAVAGGTYNLSQTFSLHSRQQAAHVIYLDFDGHTNGDVQGTSWDNLASPAWDYSGNGVAFTDIEKEIIQRVWARVSEDFAPFDVDVTTQDPGVEALRKVSTSDTNWGIRVVVTPNDAPAPGSGGVAYINSFNFATDTPAYVFNVANDKDIAETASHEAGHSLGLGHDGTAALVYYPGHGSGATSWGPIMGGAYSPNVTQWSEGEYAGANNAQDDLAIISSQNGFGYRYDPYNTFEQHNNVTGFPGNLLAKGTSTITWGEGVIETSTDADFFQFYANAGVASISVDPLSIGPNLAINAELLNAAGTVLAVFTGSQTTLNVTLSTTLPSAGKYYLKVTGAGRGDPSTNGFSNYASLGNYRITGTVPAYPYLTPPPSNQIVSRAADGTWWYTVGAPGSATTAAGPVWSNTVNWVDVTSADVTGDGLHDLIGRVKESGEWWVSVRNSGGGYTTTKWATWSPSVTWVDVRFADLDADGYADVIGRVKETGEWWVGKANGSGFVTKLWVTWNPSVNWVDVNVVDLNADGRSDILARVKESGEWWVTTSAGNISGGTTKWDTWSSAVTWVDVKTGDLNGDGRTDIIARDQTSGNWWAGMSTGYSFTTSFWTNWNPAANWVDVRLADFTGDGRADLVGRVLGSGQVWLTQTTSSGTAGTTSLWTTWNSSVQWKDVLVADFNGDGKMDIAAREPTGNEWWVNLTNSSSNGFVVSLFVDWTNNVSWFDSQVTRLTP